MRYPSPRILCGSSLRLLNCHISKNKNVALAQDAPIIELNP